VAAAGLVVCGIFIVIAAAPLGVPLIVLASIFACITNVLAFVALLTLISAAASPEEQGWALGIGGSMTALSFFLAGLGAAVLGVVPLWILIAAGGIIVIAGIAPLMAAPVVSAPPRT